MPWYHCDGRREWCKKRSDCHPGNHSSFLLPFPMPQPAPDPVLAIKRHGSSQAPRPRVSLLLRRICLEASVLEQRITYLIILLSPPCDGPSGSSSS